MSRTATTPARSVTDTLDGVLSAEDKATLRTAAYGAVCLMAAADATGSPHRTATRGSVALASATGPIGHLLARRSPIEHLGGRSTAELADRVLPALTATMALLREQAPAEAADFRRTVLTAIEAATHTRKGEPGPTLADMSRRITEALDAS